MSFFENPDLPISVLDTLPNPVLVKDEETRYVWVNAAFERLFDVRREDLVGRLDVDVFKERQAAQCNGGDLRVLATGEVDEALETVFDPEHGPRETITRKSRLTVEGGSCFLVGVMHDITEVQEINRKLNDSAKLLQNQAVELTVLANSDPLTGCLNRRALFEVADEEFARAGGTGGLVMLDLDHFKRINDHFGHGCGDAVLAKFAEMVRGLIRSTDHLARLGGEEFAVLMPGSSPEDTRAVATRICEVLAAKPLRVNGQDVAVTVSVGATHSLGRGFDLEESLAEADNRLYQAKNAGRNRVVA